MVHELVIILARLSGNFESKRMEAIGIGLTGIIDRRYGIYYSIYALNFGWVGQAKIRR